MTLQNSLIGWAEFRELRQWPTPIHARRHGNYRHGKRSVEWAEIRSRTAVSAGAGVCALPPDPTPLG
jgi:hypothetical protein